MVPRMMLTALLAVTVAANADEVDDGRQLVDHFVQDIVTFEARFDQTLADADGMIVEQTSGTLAIQRPGRFRWSYLEPYEQWLVADGTNIWSYDVDLEQVTVKPQAEALANTPALLLGGSDKALEEFDYLGSRSDGSVTWVVLEPVNRDSGFERMEMGFVDGQLQRMIFFDNLKQTTDVSFHDIKVNEPVAAELFRFDVPDGVDLVGVPVVADTQAR